MFFVLGGALLWWGALGDLMVWGVLAGGGSYVLEGRSSVLGPAVNRTASRRPQACLLSMPSPQTQTHNGVVLTWHPDS